MKPALIVTFGLLLAAGSCSTVPKDPEGPVLTQAEAQALQDVRSIAADAAIAAAERILSAKMSGKAADSQISDSIAEVKSRLQ